MNTKQWEEGFILRRLLESCSPYQTTVLGVVTPSHILSLSLRAKKRQNMASSVAALVLLQTSFSEQTEMPVVEGSEEHIE